MHPALVNRVVFPLHEWCKGKTTHAKLAELERTQWLAPDALRALQFERLRRHLEWAYREVPYYGRLLDEHGLPPRRIQSFEDFARVPHLTKDILRERLADLQPRTPLRGVQRLSTGGSTGSPVTVLVDRERAAFTDAARLRAHRWFGADMGAREVVLWGSPIELGRQDRLRSVRDWLLNSRLLSAFDLGEPALARYAAVVRAYRPQKLYGYASALALLAGYLERTGGLPVGDAPRAVFTTAEPLYDFQRAAITAGFHCPAAVEYGCRDGGLVALECPAGGLHIAAEGMHVEALPASPGESGGELVLTNLESYALPIIRYRSGDIGALDPAPCACGRGLPRLARVEGRRTDFLVAPSGKLMHALAVIYVLREVPGLREFQVIQEALDHVRVRVVPAGDLSVAARAGIIARVGGLFEGRARIEVEVAESVASASGKHRYVISRVADAHVSALMGAA
jgi:phenylacetate-CoA ligase